ncbi:hypothetical protein [Daejeonella oryzae]|uniref:hypothetical protein n=1 Tax=Daejeonella oryzae TaxID=1122943 RepID=UPI000412AE73|nr:hypothetical protein [Daejeonella oryzae]
MKYLYILLICGGLVKSSSAQQDSTAKSSLTLAAIYGNTANYFGQTTEEKLPYVLSYGAYKLKSGIYFSASALNLLNSSSIASAVDLSAGYGFNLLKNVPASISYTRSFYEKNSPLIQTSNENNINGELSFTHFLKTGISADYAFGQQNDVFVSLSNSKLIDLGSLFSDKDFISLEPGISIIAGSQRFYRSYTTEREKRKKLLDPLFPGQRPEPVTTTVESTSFNVMAYMLSVPLAYNRTNYSIEAAYQASLASKNIENASDKPVSIFNLGFYYMF